MVKKERKTSKMWQFFEKLNSIEALCNLCHKTFKHSQNTTTLKLHIIRHHKDINVNEIMNLSSKINEETTPVKESVPKVRQTSKVWKYFEKLNSQQATCNICMKNVQHCGNTSNLKMHIRRNHKGNNLEDISYAETRPGDEDNAAAKSLQTSVMQGFEDVPKYRDVYNLEMRSSGNRTVSDWINLNVGGTQFTTTRRTLMKQPDSMLAKLFHKNQRKDQSQMGETKTYLIDRDPVYFRVILNYLRNGELIIDRQVSHKGVFLEAEYFGIHFEERATDIIKLNVSGQQLIATRQNLGKLNINKIDLSYKNMDDNGAFMVDRNFTYFAAILNYIRDGEIVLDSSLNNEGIFREARHFGIDSLAKDVLPSDYVRLNVGGTQIYCETYVLEKLGSKIDFSKANKDETGATIVDRHPDGFMVLLNFLRDNTYDFANLDTLRNEVDYFGIQLEGIEGEDTTEYLEG